MALNDLRHASEEFLAGSVAVSLGGHLYKKRVNHGKRGKRGGARTILFYVQDQRMVFVHGFLKNEKANISAAEKKLLKTLAKILLAICGGHIRSFVRKFPCFGAQYSRE